MRVVQSEGTAPARPKAVDAVAVDAEDPVACLFRVLVEHARRTLVQILPIVPHRSVEVEVAAAAEVVLPPNAERFGRTDISKCRECAAKRIMRARVADAELLPLLCNRSHIGDRARPHVAVAPDAADGEEVALPERARVVEECAVLVTSRIAIPAVVDADVPPHAVALGLHIYDKIGRALPAPRLQLCARLNAREVTRQPHAAVQRFFFHRIAGRDANLAANCVIC